MTDEQRAAFERLSPEQQDAVLAALQAILDADTDAQRRRLQRAKNEARRAAFALRKAKEREQDVRLDEDVFGELRSLFDDSQPANGDGNGN